MEIEFIIENNKLYKKDSIQTISQNANDITLTFKTTEDWENYTVFCLIKTTEYTYRLILEKIENNLSCELPQKVTNTNFIKISLYGVNGNKRITTNELIIPINRSGYLEYKPVPHKDRFHHHGKYHYHHNMLHGFHPVKTPHHYHHPRGESIYDEYHVDIYDYILSELKESINFLQFDDLKCYAYHEDELLQIIPLPDFVTRHELNDFFGDLVSDIEFSSNGDVKIVKSSFDLNLE